MCSVILYDTNTITNKEIKLILKQYLFSKNTNTDFQDHLDAITKILTITKHLYSTL